MVKSIDQLLEQLFEGFNPKQRKVVAGRFGMKGGEQVTLQEIGDELGITRERVRQIEAQTLRKLAPLVRARAKDFLKFAAEYLEGVGGVRRDDCLVHDLRNVFFKADRAKYLDQKIRFLLLAGGVPHYAEEDDAMHAYWYSSDAAQKKFLTFVERITQFFKHADRKSLLEGKVHAGALCKDFTSCHLLSIPRRIGTNVFGDVGLAEWPEITPKTVRDKAYLVLKKHSKPLHFGEIAKYIHRFGIDTKPAHVQTVHNELIKDSRFVLVGRGMYGLGEHGYEPGTVREVIARILRKHGPMASEKVVKLVNEQRFLKENTILLSLQSRKHFTRLDDGRYHVKQA